MTTLICCLVALLLLTVDQVTKLLAHAVNIHQGNYFLGIVRLSYTSNHGMAFSIGGNNPMFMTFVTILTVVMIIALAVLSFTVFAKNKPARYALAVVISGAIGNLIDRALLSDASGRFVRDFIDVSRLGFGICNVADFCITFGAVALIFIVMFIGKHAVFPLTKKWRAEAKADEETREEKKKEKLKK